MKKAELLEIAKAAVADRGLNYGRPEDNFARIAALWTQHLRNRYSEPGAEVDMSAWDGSVGRQRGYRRCRDDDGADEGGAPGEFAWPPR